MLPLAARAMVTAIVLGQGIIPLFVDLNRTHATHPLWPGHARFHVVWQTITASLTGAFIVWLLWWHGPEEAARFYLAAILTAIPLLGFLAALAARRLYAGALHDPKGIQPLILQDGDPPLAVDMNAVLVIAAAIILIAAVLLF